MKQFRNMLYPYVVWLFIMVLVPMLMILLYAFTTAGNEVTTFRFTLDNFSRFLTDTVFLDVLKRSLLIAVVTTVVCVLLGYPIAYTIAKGPERSGFFWIMLITLPTWINMLVRTYAWVGILQDDGLVNRFLGMLGIGSDGHFAGRGHLQHDPFVVRHRPRVDDPHELCRHPRHGL